MKNWFSDRQLTFLIAMNVAIVLLATAFSDGLFIDIDNLQSMGGQVSELGILSIAVMLAMISGSGGIDLSVVALANLSGVIAGLVVPHILSPDDAPLAFTLGFVALALVVGALGGLINGLLVTKMTIPPFIATLGLMMSVRGINMVMTDGRAIYFADYPTFKMLAQGRLFDVLPYPVFYLVVVALIAAYILKKTVIGRYVYAVGSNEVAAHLSGIKVQRVKIFVYAFCGLLTGIAGVILASRLNSGQPTVGVGYELEAIAAVVIGGTSLMGGIGTIGGTIIGAFIMSVLKNGLNLMGVSQFWQMVAMGVVVIAAVYLDTLRKKIR